MQNWKESNNKLEKEFKFKDFKKTLEFVNKVGEIAEKVNHHPEIFFTWGKCTITLTTHDEGNKVTQKDKDLATQIDHI